MIVILNGPPGSGKDTAANHITANYNAVHMKFSWPMKRIFDPVFRVGESTARKMVNEGRDIKQPLLNDYTPREVQIIFYEEFLKKYFGEDILGHIACREMEGIKAPLIIFSDGYGPELQPVIDKVGHKRTKVIKITRPDYNWGDKGDYKTKIEFEGIEEQVIDNRFDLEMYLLQVERVMDKWVIPRR